MLPHPLLLLASCLAPLAAAGRYCQPGDSCWPSPAQVEEFAASLTQVTISQSLRRLKAPSDNLRFKLQSEHH